MQLDLPFLRARPRPEPQRLAAPPASIDFVLVRERRARRYIVRVRSDGTVRVTIPRGGSRAEALRFLESQTEWILRERTRVRTSHGDRRWLDGSNILLRGMPVLLSVQGDQNARVVSYAGRQVRIPEGAVDLRPHVEADLRALARAELEPKLHALARRHDLVVRAVSIRNQRSRWGSCSRGGNIALNFRLVQMPPEVSDYILVHELMHLKQQNHSVRFWRLVKAAWPEFRDAERWLKNEGRRLF